jgi:chaperonin GroES
MTTNVKPLGDRVLVQPLEEKEVKKGGIIIPDSAREKPQEGTVAAIGTGKLDDNGKKIEFTVKVGDKVLISKYGGTEIKIDGDNYRIMREDDILGITTPIKSTPTRSKRTAMTTDSSISVVPHWQARW